MLDIAHALHFLHTLPLKIIHRDVKSQNVLVDLDTEGRVNRAALCDFGVSKQVIKKKPINDPVGTSRWMAPEVHKTESYNELVDIWSFGMLLFEVLTLKIPYKNIPFLDVKEHVCAGNLPDLVNIPNTLQHYKPLFYQCTKQDHTQRWSALQCIEYLNKM